MDFKLKKGQIELNISGDFAEVKEMFELVSNKIPMNQSETYYETPITTTLLNRPLVAESNSFLLNKKQAMTFLNLYN